jgi:hypothetical protein
MRIAAAIGAALVLLAIPTRASADNVTLANSGPVYLHYLDLEPLFGKTERYNSLYITSPRVRVVETGCRTYRTDAVMSNIPAASGCTIRLDSNPDTPEVDDFQAGTVFTFRLCAADTPGGSCAETFFSDASLNPNGEEHAALYAWAGYYDPNTLIGSSERDILLWSDKKDVFHDPTPGLAVTVIVVRDSDGDGLWDEEEFTGIDTDGDQGIDLNLRDLGATAWHKDVFVYIDYMDCNLPGSDCPPGDTHIHIPKTSALDAVRQAFASAPLPNSRGGDGIDLHIELGQPIPHHMLVDFPDSTGAVPSGSISFDVLKDQFLPPDDPRRWAYHYGVFVHKTSTGMGGQGEQPGNDFFVSLGGSCNPPGCGDADGDGLQDTFVGTVAQQATSLMHELGHNLGLSHGGGEEDDNHRVANRKPNYQSIMNYDFYWGIPPVDPDVSGPLVFRLDYSREALASLDETQLNEPAGISSADDTFHHCGFGGAVRVPGNSPIDWNCDGAIQATPVSANVNADCLERGDEKSCETGDTARLSTLLGHEDWHNLNYHFHSADDFPGGSHDSAPVEPRGSDTGPPLAEAGEDVTVECESSSGTPVTIGVAPVLQDIGWTYTWLDDAGAVVANTPKASVLARYGRHTYTLIVANDAGNTASDTVQVSVIDTIPPEMTSSVSPTLLWPPDHKLQNVLAQVESRDVCSATTVWLSSISSSETDETQGDGHTLNDIQGADIGKADFAFALRRERTGRGTGRRYDIAYTSADEAGNLSTSTTSVIVPHDAKR